MGLVKISGCEVVSDVLGEFLNEMSPGVCDVYVNPANVETVRDINNQDDRPSAVILMGSSEAVIARGRTADQVAVLLCRKGA